MFKVPKPASRLYGTFQLYPKGKIPLRKVQIFLSAVGSPPAEAIDYQLWIQNHTDVDQSATFDLKKLMPLRTGSGVNMSLNAQDDAREQNAQMCMQLNTSLQTSFVSFLDDSVTADVVLKAGKTKLHAHRIILAAQSALFKAMFQPGTKEASSKTVDIKEIDGSTLKHMVLFMYGQSPHMNIQMAMPLFVAADAHQVEELRWICLQYLICSVNPNTVLHFVQLAEKLSDSILMDACVQFLTESDARVQVAEQDAMKALMQNNPDLAQKLLIAVMKHPALPKRKADDMS